MSLIDFIEDYYLPIMKIDKNIPCIQSLFLAITNGDKLGVEKSYYELVQYIKNEVSIDIYPVINLYFNRMRYEIYTSFDLNLQYIYFN
jgi:hypothetical protein